MSRTCRVSSPQAGPSLTEPIEPAPLVWRSIDRTPRIEVLLDAAEFHVKGDAGDKQAQDKACRDGEKVFLHCGFRELKSEQ